jgi:hypothetical protein
MTALVLLDHEEGRIRQAALSAVTAATKLGDVHVLVAGADAVAQEAAKIAGVSKVLHAADARYAHELAEPLAALIVSLAGGYDHIVAAAGAVGKNVLPRAAALLDVQPIPDVISIVDADTFVRPIYAGNALATVKSSDSKKVLTIRSSAPLMQLLLKAALLRWRLSRRLIARKSQNLTPCICQNLNGRNLNRLGWLCRVVVVFKAKRSSTFLIRWLTRWVLPLVHPVRLWIPALCRTTIRSARPARS